MGSFVGPSPADFSRQAPRDVPFHRLPATRGRFALSCDGLCAMRSLEWTLLLVLLVRPGPITTISNLLPSTRGCATYKSLKITLVETRPPPPRHTCRGQNHGCQIFVAWLLLQSRCFLHPVSHAPSHFRSGFAHARSRFVGRYQLWPGRTLHDRAALIVSSSSAISSS